MTTIKDDICSLSALLAEGDAQKLRDLVKTAVAFSSAQTVAAMLECGISPRDLKSNEDGWAYIVTGISVALLDQPAHRWSSSRADA